MKIECRRCLLNELDGESFKNVYEYIENLPADIKAGRELYEYRLNLCRSCDHLINGMCSLCGCFVEARAAKITAHCAKSNKIW